MNKKNIIRLSYVFLMLLCAACATVKPVAQREDNFYKTYSEKLGVKFQGSEDKRVIECSAKWMGVPYKYGGCTQQGVDCSALVGNIYKDAYSFILPRSTAGLAKQIKQVSKADIQCGDLVFFTIKEKKVSHVGVYLGEDKFVHASTSSGVSIASLGDVYWSKYFSGIGRIPVPVMQPSSYVKSSSEVVKEQPNKKEIAAIDKNKSVAAKKDEVLVVFDEEF